MQSDRDRAQTCDVLTAFEALNNRLLRGVVVSVTAMYSRVAGFESR